MLQKSKQSLIKMRNVKEKKKEMLYILLVFQLYFSHIV